MKPRLQDIRIARFQERMKAGKIEIKQSFNISRLQCGNKECHIAGLTESNKQIHQPIMNGNNMENGRTPLYVAFSTQKGGVGKTTFTVLAASYLHYLKGYDVAVVDCDYPQHSIAGMRKRDAETVSSDEEYKRMAYEQFTRLGKKAYPVLCSPPEKAIATADEYVAGTGDKPDIVFFDLPGTVNSEGVISSLAGMDYIFTPDFRRQGGAGKQPVVRGGYPQAAGEKRSLPTCRAVPLLEHGGRSGENRPLYRLRQNH